MAKYNTIFIKELIDINKTPIGNYTIQYLLSLKASDITLNIINKIINNISFYCKHRYANYVIEKYLYILIIYKNRV